VRAVGGNTTNGTVTVTARGTALAPNATDGTATVTVGTNWVVDESGDPYGAPDGTTLPVAVMSRGNATDGHERSRSRGQGAQDAIEDGRGSRRRKHGRTNRVVRRR